MASGGSYRIEVSPNNRAVCRNKECKDEGNKIFKGTMRYGTFITGPNFQSWQWRHWGCVTPKQIINLKTTTGGDATELDGYDELPEGFQTKVKEAIVNGHVDDEDWNGDVEMNREGKNGMRTPETKRRMKEEAQALKDEAMVEGSASPRNTTTKKRSLVKEDLDTAAADQNEPAKKKTKPAPKKEKRVKKEGIDGGSEDEPPATKKTKAATKKGRKVKDEETDEEFEEAGLPVKKARSQAKSIKREDGSAVHAKDGSNDHDAQSAPVMKKTRARRKAAKGAKFRYEDADSDEPRQASEVEDSLNKVKLEDGSSDNEAPANGRSPDPTKSSITPVKKAANRIEAMAKVDQGINPKHTAASGDVKKPQRSNGRATRSRPT